MRESLERRRVAFARRAVWSLCALLLLLGVPPARAELATKFLLEERVKDAAETLRSHPKFKNKSPQQILDGVEFVTGNTLFVLAHETAHALISEMGIPVIGREEDAADAMAALLALRMKNAFADRVVANAAKGWFLSDQRDKKEGAPAEYYDEHGMDLQRAYYIVCLMVGAEPEKFKALADEVKMPEERQHTCRDDYNNASWSWEQVLKSHFRTPEQPKTTIEVSYGPATGEVAMFAEIGRKLQILEGAATMLSNQFAWKQPIRIEGQTCGDPGARWEFRSKKIVVCYELVAEFGALHRKYGNAKLVPGTVRLAKNKKTILVSAKPRQAKARARNALRSYRAQR